MASTYLLNILIIVANKNKRWIAANLQPFQYTLNKLKKMQPRHLFIQTKHGQNWKINNPRCKTSQHVFHEVAEDLVAVKLLAFDRPFQWNSDGGCPLVLVTWVGAGLDIEPVGSARLVEDGRQAPASDRSDKPVQMLNCNIRLLLAREPALMNGKIFLTTPTESIMSVPCRAS